MNPTPPQPDTTSIKKPPSTATPFPRKLFFAWIGIVLLGGYDLYQKHALHKETMRFAEERRKENRRFAEERVKEHKRFAEERHALQLELLESNKKVLEAIREAYGPFK